MPDVYESAVCAKGKKRNTELNLVRIVHSLDTIRVLLILVATPYYGDLMYYRHECLDWMHAYTIV